MKHKSLAGMPCPIARSLERVGEWWSILIMRDALHGYTRFDQFAKSLGIAPNMLARRLEALVEAGLLERRRYSQHPPRDEYVPTSRGRDFRPVLIAFLAWGNKHFAPDGPAAPPSTLRRFGLSATASRRAKSARPARARDTA
jgi:DNA-binding HxlR family transcriptional regulator